MLLGAVDWIVRSAQLANMDPFVLQHFRLMEPDLSLQLQQHATTVKRSTERWQAYLLSQRVVALPSQSCKKTQLCNRILQERNYKTDGCISIVPNAWLIKWNYYSYAGFRIVGPIALGF